MSLTIPTPSGTTLQQWLQDGEAIVNAPLEAFFPADAMALVTLGEKLLAVFAAIATQNGPSAVLTSEVDSEQAAGDAAEDRRFPPTEPAPAPPAEPEPAK
jgi:hypothetical protein